MKKLILFFLLLLSVFGVKAQAQIDTLICVSNQLNGDVLLSLSPPANPCPGCIFVGYNVYYSTSFAGPYTQFVPNPTISNPAAVTFTHIGANGNSTTYYYYLETVCNCGGVNVYANTDTIDNQDPVAPAISNVSVNGTHAVIKWTPSPSPETFAYVIYYVQGGNFIIDTVYGHNSTTYTDVIAAHDPLTNSCAYTIAALDRCNTLGVFNLNPQHSILLKTIQDRCAQSVKLDWNFYTNWTGGVMKYVLFASVNGGAYLAKQTLSNTDQSFTFSGLHDGDQICYFVRAYQNGGIHDSSTSNIRCEKINIVQAPAYNQFQTCSDLSSNSVNLEWIADPNADLTNFQISEGTSASNLTPLITIGATIPGAALYNYLHAGIDQTLVHYYAISAIDSCGQGHLITTSHTIVLSGITTTQNYNHLSWNKFEMDSAIVLYYDIYRTIDAGSKVYLGSVNDTIFDFYDDIKSFYATQGDICYQIIANYKFKSSLLPSIYFSNSNTWCSTPFSSIYLPNAVFPKGNNKIFKPLITFPNFSNYKLEIYNRWGERIFTSLDYNVGWDGTANGKDAIEGNYTYTVSFSKQDGKEFVKQGNVSVIY